MKKILTLLIAVVCAASVACAYSAKEKPREATPSGKSSATQKSTTAVQKKSYSRTGGVGLVNSVSGGGSGDGSNSSGGGSASSVTIYQPFTNIKVGERFYIPGPVTAQPLSPPSAVKDSPFWNGAVKDGGCASSSANSLAAHAWISLDDLIIDTYPSEAKFYKDYVLGRALDNVLINDVHLCRRLDDKKDYTCDNLTEGSISDTCYYTENKEFYDKKRFILHFIRCCAHISCSVEQVRGIGPGENFYCFEEK